nr:NADH-quinone oxidoreductase subunit H [Sulfurospirillum sp.]
NRFQAKADIRNRESAVLIKGIALLNALVLVFLGALLFFGLSQTEANIATAVVQIATFAFKLLLMNFVFVWVRWTLPRFRYDQLQDLGWKVLMPLAIANIFITATVVVVFGV